MKTIFSCLVLLSCLVSPQIALGALKVGDPAPKIQVSRWVQGDEVKDFEGDKVYIVEFWATWCGPCVASIPHLDEVYRKFKDKGLVVIGQNVMEDDAKAVSAFVKSMAGKMSYRVTLDDKTDGGWMAKHWLTAAGQNGIPCAFVVSKKGKIAYIGHPMSLKESLLESLLNEPSTKPVSAAPLPAAAPSVKAEELAKQAENNLRSGKLDEAEASIAALHEEIPDSFRYRAGLLDMELLISRKLTDDALQLSKLLCEDFAKDSAVLVSVASCLASAPNASANLLDAAEKIAKPISLASGPSKDPAAAVLASIATRRSGEKSP